MEEKEAGAAADGRSLVGCVPPICSVSLRKAGKRRNWEACFSVGLWALEVSGSPVLLVLGASGKCFGFAGLVGTGAFVAVAFGLRVLRALELSL